MEYSYPFIYNPFVKLYKKTAREIAYNSFPSVVMLVMEDSNGQPLSLGSGFFVREGIVATNLHVIEGASKGYAKIVGKKAKYDISSVMGIDTKRDLVLLAIRDAKAPSLSLGDSHQVAVGDEIYAIGNPQGLEGTFSQGIIGSIREVGPDKILQITAPISPGSSGGPVLRSHRCFSSDLQRWSEPQFCHPVELSQYTACQASRSKTLGASETRKVFTIDPVRFGRQEFGRCYWDSVRVGVFCPVYIYFSV